MGYSGLIIDCDLFHGVRWDLAKCRSAHLRKHEVVRTYNAFHIARDRVVVFEPQEVPANRKVCSRVVLP